jgi:hypothetical protein
MARISPSEIDMVERIEDNALLSQAAKLQIFLATRWGQCVPSNLRSEGVRPSGIE